ncbi:histidinol phosphate phosphatase domain-containing protein [Solidesulfovibrio sp.]
MIDLHTHTTFSDGVLIPAELARRAAKAGYRAMAMTDHADHSNLDLIISNISRFTAEAGAFLGVTVLCGVEITHVPPPLVPQLVERARAAGAQIVVVHGETIVEPVETGTNLAAIEAGCDILAHPGLITPEEAELAAERGVALEITTRKGHSLTNGHVAVLARRFGARLVINNDAHEPGDLVSQEHRKKAAFGAGLTLEEYRQAEANSRDIVSRILGRGRAE